LHPLHLAKQVAQPVVLAGELIALFDKPPFLGPLGIALGPGRRSAATSSGRVSGVVTPGIISSHRRGAIPQPQDESA